MAPKTKQANQPQNFTIYPCQLLQGCLDSKQGLLMNGCFYKVIEADYKTVKLQSVHMENFIVNTQIAAKSLRMTHGLTYASIEGLTLKGRIRLCDTNHPKFDWRKLYVGLSRATSSDLVEVML